MSVALEELFFQLWKDYSAMNPQAEKIHKALEARGERVINDHVAFRTFDIPLVGIEVLARPFLKLGYRLAGNYEFKDKKLIARHYEHPDARLPKVFISALKVSDCSEHLQKRVQAMVNQIPEDLPERSDFLISGAPWKKIFSNDYWDLLKESEYAAWMSAFGFRVNHFTVFFNALKTFRDFQGLNHFIKDLGFKLNTAGGETKGSKEVLLEQSSTLAHPVEIQFSDKKEMIPGCYYEFARRYMGPDGMLFQGFLPDSAQKLFESTDRRPE